MNPHAYNMRTDYYVVSPNSRAYTRGWLRVLWKGACARAWRISGNPNYKFIQMQDQCFSLYSKAQLIIRIQFYNNLQPHLLPEHPCFEHIQILTELLWHLTTKHPWHGRSVSLYILIFSILNSFKYLVVPCKVRSTSLPGLVALRPTAKAFRRLPLRGLEPNPIIRSLAFGL